MDKIKFGPSGSGDFAKIEGVKSTKDVPSWLSRFELDCYEVSFGRGVNLSQELSASLKNSFISCNIEVSAHCPYYINLATQEEDKALKNIVYITSTMERVRLMGGRRSVFHPGSPLKLPRAEAMDIAKVNLETVLGAIHGLGLEGDILAVETMGKVGQLGSVSEVIDLCKMDSMLYPCIDFGHVNSRDNGCLKGYQDYQRLIDELYVGLGEEKVNNMHVHFSKIEYSQKGEVRHLTFKDTQYGPDFEPLMQLFSDYKMTPYVICESAGSQVEDAQTMKKYYQNVNTNK